MNKMPDHRTRWLVHASLFATAIVWGGNFTAVKYLLRDLEPLDIAFLRGVATALLAAALLVATGRPVVSFPRADVARMVALGTVGVAGVSLAAATGQRLLPAALASLIVSSNPIFTAVLSRLFAGERFGRRRIAGAALSLLGLIVVVLYGSGGDAALTGGRIEGVFIFVLSPLSWACYSVLSKPLLARHSPTHVSSYMLLAGSTGLLSLPLFGAASLDRIDDLSPGGWGAVGYSTILAGALAYVIWTRGLRILSANQASVYGYLVPVFGLLCPWFLLGETITWFLLLGGTAILAGVVLTKTSPAPAVRPRIGSEGRSAKPGLLWHWFQRGAMSQVSRRTLPDPLP